MAFVNVVISVTINIVTLCLGKLISETLSTRKVMHQVLVRVIRRRTQPRLLKGVVGLKAVVEVAVPLMENSDATVNPIGVNPPTAVSAGIAVPHPLPLLVPIGVVRVHLAGPLLGQLPLVLRVEVTMGGPVVDSADTKEIRSVDFTTVAVQAHVGPPGRPAVDAATILKVGGTDPTAAMVVATGDIASNEVQHPQ